MPFEDGSFDVLPVAFGLRNMADWGKAVAEMRRLLRPGGHLLVLDFSLPKGPLCGPYRFYLHRVLPKLAGWLTGQKDAYEYLGGSIEDFPRGEAMLELLGRNGFDQTAQRRLSFGVATIYTGLADGQEGRNGETTDERG